MPIQQRLNSFIEEGKRGAMRVARNYVLGLGLVFGLTLGAPVALSGVDAPVATSALTLFVDDAAAFQSTVDCTIVAGNDALGLCAGSDNEGGAGGPGTGGVGGPGADGRGGASRSTAGDGGDSGNAGDGGFSSVHDVGTAHANASSSVIVGDVMTGDVNGHTIHVDARGATRPVVTLVAGSFGDTGVDIFAPGGNAQAGTTGGNANMADSSGGDSGDAGDGGDATSHGGDGGSGTGGQGGPGTGGIGAPGGDTCSALLGCIDLDLGLGLP